MTGRVTESIERIRIEANARVVASHHWLERSLLMFLLFMLYVAYGALGRDVFYNHLYYKFGVTVDDPIGAVLPYVRVLLCFATIGLVVFCTNLNWAVSKIPWLLAPFVILALVSAAWADDAKDTVRNAVMAISLWIALPMLVHRLGLKATMVVTMHVIAAVCIISFLLAILLPNIGRHSGLEAVQESHVGEWRGIFAHKNSLGPWAAWGSVFMFAFARLGGGFRLYWWFAGACALVCLVFCHSATSLVAFAFMWTLWFGFVLLRRFPLSTVMIVAGVPALVIGVSIFMMQDDIFATLGRDSTFTGRTLIWALDWEYFTERPFFGGGFDTLGGPVFLARLVAMFDQPLSPESAYFEMLLDLGIVGTILFFIPFFISIRNGFEWMKHVADHDRACLEMLIITLFSVLLIGFTEGQILLSTGFDGVISFTALFVLMTTPKSPSGVLRGEFRMARYRLAPFRKHSSQRLG